MTTDKAPKRKSRDKIRVEYIHAISGMELPPVPRSILAFMASRATEIGFIEVSMAEISRRTGYSRITVLRAIAMLENEGLLEIKPTTGKVNAYKLTGMRDRVMRELGIDLKPDWLPAY